MDIRALLFFIAAAPDLTLHPEVLPPPDAGTAAASTSTTTSKPDVTAIFRVGREGEGRAGREYRLQKHPDGSYTYDDDLRFDARIAPDGSVTFQDKKTLRLRQPTIVGLTIDDWRSGKFKQMLEAARRGAAPDPMTGISPYHASPANERDSSCVNGRLGCRHPPWVSSRANFDANDAVMRAAGQDPYYYEKMRFMEETAELRIRMAVENRREVLQQALDALPARLDELWADERWSPVERRRIVVLLLAEIERSEPAGAPAAEILRRFICTRFPFEARREAPGVDCR